MFNTPILLITFNRPSHTRKVLERIMEQHPRDLYVFQDGAREDNAADKEKCRQVQAVVEELTINTDTALHTLYNSKNLGCGAGPMTGIDWFFQNVESGIVLEDDCLVHPDFFGYCEELLTRYDADPYVRFINATLYDDRWHCDSSYAFSRYMVTGAWASWRTAWQSFSLDLQGLKAKDVRRQVYRLTENRVEADWWYFLTKQIQMDHDKKSYWDYQMQICLFMQDAVTIHPSRNLVSNIGFDPEGTHTLGNDGRGVRPVYPILPLVHPDEIVVDKARDNHCWAKAHSKGWLSDKVSFLYNSLLWSDGLGYQLLKIYKHLKGKTLVRPTL